MDSWLKKKKDPPKKSWIEDNTNEESTSEQQENGRADSSTVPGICTMPATGDETRMI